MDQRAPSAPRRMAGLVWADPVIRWCAALCLMASTWFVFVVVVSPVEPMVAGWSLTPVVVLLAAWVCWRAGGRADEGQVSRRFWRRIAVALVVFGVSMVSRIADSVNADLSMTTRLSLVSAALHAAGLALLMWPLFTLPVGLRTRTQRVALWLDLGTVIVATATFAWHFAAGAILAAPGRSAVTAWVSIALITAGLACVLIIAKVAMTGTQALHPRALHLLGAALGVGGLGTALVIVLVHQTDVDTSLLVVPPAVLLIAMAARYDLLLGVPTAAVGRTRRRFSILPYAAVAATDALMLVAIALDTDDRFLIATAGVGLTALVIARQVMAFRDNDALLTRLDAGLLEIRRTERRFRSLVQNSTDVVSLIDASGTLVYISPSVGRVLKRQPADLIGSVPASLVHPDDQDDAAAAIATIAATPGATVTYELRLQHADGSWRWLETTSANLLDDPSVAAIVTNARDITDTREAQQRLRYEATHDALTGLANRALFTTRLDACRSLDDPEHRYTIVIVDLDGFKPVNDTFGHAVGDGLLVAVAETLRAGVRAQDTVARLGGDEFVLLLDNLSGDAAQQTVERVIDALAVPVNIDGHLLVVRASFGAAEGRTGDDPAMVMRQADLAMYQAKETGAGGFQRYHEDMHAGVSTLPNN